MLKAGCVTNSLAAAFVIFFSSATAKIYSKELLEAMFFEFYTKTSYIEKTLGVSERTSLRYLNTLVDTGFLVSEKMGRERIYKNQRLFDIIKQFESTI